MSSLVRICLKKAAAQAPRINISRPLSFTQITRGQASNNEPVPAGLEKYELQAKQVGNDVSIFLARHHFLLLNEVSVAHW